jgi:hypothetical protein
MDSEGHSLAEESFLSKFDRDHEENVDFWSTVNLPGNTKNSNPFAKTGLKD